MKQSPPRVLIEDWLPIDAIGAESKRERGASSALPPLYFLHVWWARRPLVTSSAAILGGVLPAWSPNWPQQLRQKFPDQSSYHQWFLKLNGIMGDPVAARKKIDYEKLAGIKTPGNKYGYPRAFTNHVGQEDLELLDKLLKVAWGRTDLSVLDPFSGGGSIPFESLRFGFTTYANELNPVASFILKTTLDYPARFGRDLIEDLKKWGNRWCELAQPKLKAYFMPPPGSPERTIYMWARSVACPVTGKPVPLAPNWWISRNPSPIAVRLLTEDWREEPSFQIVYGKDIDFDPNIGTVNMGKGRSPWTNEVVSGEYIKAEAQAGRMKEILYCIEIRTNSETKYIAPNESDIKVACLAENDILNLKLRWFSGNIIPNEQVPEGNKTSEPHRYGMLTWNDLFSPRQLLTMGIYLETLHQLEKEIHAEVEHERAEAILAYCGVMLNKCPNYNSRLASWHASRGIIRSVFDRHDFSFKWTFVEFNASLNLLPWAVDQVISAYQGIADLAAPSQLSLMQPGSRRSVDRLTIHQGSASSLDRILSNSIDNITVDPPYYDNVQYAELSDFFYVWLKRSVGHIFPDFFNEELTNKDDEAVANPARFTSLGKKKKELANQDYERKMAAAFREMYRVLQPDGVLTVMFTHKKVEAWDTLAAALIGAGFVIQASWPIHTESEHSLHQAKKNAAASTILLVCRKRTIVNTEPVWWDDIQGQVRRMARTKAQEYANQGIGGVDLYISTFGPTLSVISQQWPVLTSEIDLQNGQPKPLRPEIALDLARTEVIRLRKEGLLAGRALTFDAVTDWYLMAWDAFKAEQFPYDEARKLAIALGLDLDKMLMNHKKLVAKKGQFVVLQKPEERRKRDMVDVDAMIFEHWIDAVHTTMLVYNEDGAGACDVFLMNRGLKRDATFKAVLQAMINAIPRNRVKGNFVRAEADILDRIRLAFYADELVALPEETLEPIRPEQLVLTEDDGILNDFEDEENEDDE